MSDNPLMPIAQVIAFHKSETDSWRQRALAAEERVLKLLRGKTYIATSERLPQERRSYLVVAEFQSCIHSDQYFGERVAWFDPSRQRWYLTDDLTRKIVIHFWMELPGIPEGVGE